jgi:hypothetical protein
MLNTGVLAITFTVDAVLKGNIPQPILLWTVLHIERAALRQIGEVAGARRRHDRR